MDTTGHRIEGGAVLLEHIPVNTTRRILDLGTGNGRLIKLLKKHVPNIAEVVGIDVSSYMIKAARENFDDDAYIKIIEHDLNTPLPYSNEVYSRAKSNAVVSSFAIHHLTHERKRTLYLEVFSRACQRWLIKQPLITYL